MSALLAPSVKPSGGRRIRDHEPKPAGRRDQTQAGPYQTGLLVCYGNVLAVFVTGESDTQTVVEIVERHFSRAQLVGCRAQMPAYIERLNAKVSAARARGSAPNLTGGQR
jgi:hypothetical protein